MSEARSRMRILPAVEVGSAVSGRVLLRSSSLLSSLAETPNSTPATLDYLLYPDGRFNPDWRDGLLNAISEHAVGDPVTYIVPGDPLSGDVTVQHLLALQQSGDLEISIERPISPGPLERAVSTYPAPYVYVDAVTLLEVDAARPFVGGSLPLSSNQTTILTNLVPDAVEPVRRLLARHYGDETMLQRVGWYGGEAQEPVSVSALEADDVDGDSCLIVAAATGDRFYRSSDDLQRLVARLRAPGGCPWDQKQTNESLTRNLIEESYELLEAIESGQIDEMREEMGDFLLQAYLHCQIAEECERFTLEDVLDTLITKLVRRHPHVFASVDAEDADHVVRNWDEIKRAERAEKPEGVNGGPLGNVPVSLPALARAQTLLKRSRRMELAPGTIANRRDGAIAQLSASEGNTGVLQHLLQAIEQAAEEGIDAEDVLRRWTREFECFFDSSENPADEATHS